MDLIRAVFKLASPQQERCLNSNQGSLMQGMMMQKIRPAYAELLHRSELKPYSQYLRKRDERQCLDFANSYSRCSRGNME